MRPPVITTRSAKCSAPPLPGGVPRSAPAGSASGIHAYCSTHPHLLRAGSSLLSFASVRSHAFAIITATIAGVALMAPTASASESQCPSGYSCVWTDADYQGSYSGRGNANYDEWHALGGRVFNDSISSLKNRYTGTKTWFEDANRGGAQLRILSGHQVSNLQRIASGKNYHPDWNDFISSVD
ncbi:MULTISPECIES: peptidase inhibitor family I36 protein [unclassified Rathayibacter]|uniref:peptidase inhibitor family I36 protein n=2 Tax=unclassified Rathayibacter TaxID=2609250 RepID=UPI000CE810D7|nr:MULTISPECIES: peptidase inhibitor family I36 protein [unclassified Rathayibacter]PPF16177.1 hypothetical protein C5B92_12370 [Rathayibacter sp. AY1A4]PPG77980.1 hypothetical protein C5C52_13925 [Rathayibacter sp. AY1E5]PPH28147.1 hypothetical protein C5C94_14215 [Rathayibacter sp. AY1C3]PPH64021.1 hypothetical protein C5D25_06360 [Rathayibacter sp. AY1D7]PPI29936.1 hypothetical protein C5D66_10030 [Rathayibacter sp. AY1B4]